MQPIDALLSKPEQRLLSAVLVRPDRDFGTMELIERMGSGRGAGSRVLARWTECGLLREKKIGRQRRLSADPAFVLYPELRSIVMKTIALTVPLAAALAPFAGRLVEAFVFGSVAAGTDASGSDIDVALVGDVGLFDVSPILDRAQHDLGRPVHVSLYTPSEWAATNPVLDAIKASPRIDLMEAIRAETA